MEYCPNCGYKLTTSQAPISELQSKSRSNIHNQNLGNSYSSVYLIDRRHHRLILKIIIVVVIFLLVGSGVFIHHKLGSFHHQVWGSILRVQDAPHEIIYFGNYKNSRFAFAHSRSDLPSNMNYISKKKCLRVSGVLQALAHGANESEEEVFKETDFKDYFSDTNTEITYFLGIKSKDDKSSHYDYIKTRFYDIKKLANKRWSAKEKMTIDTDGKIQTDTSKRVSIQKVN